MKKINKGAKQASESTNVKQFIEKAAASPSKKMKRGRMQQLREVAKTKRPACNEWYGLENPMVLNISIDTLNKLGERK